MVCSALSSPSALNGSVSELDHHILAKFTFFCQGNCSFAISLSENIMVNSLIMKITTALFISTTKQSLFSEDWPFNDICLY